MRTFFIQLLIGSCLFQYSKAQIDSVTWPLPMAEVLEEHPPAMHYDLLARDSSDASLVPLYFSSSDLLQFSSGAYLRDYGNQSLSTLSVRGGSSQQTEILWNGARISNPMLGLGDISVLPLIFFSDIHLLGVQQNGVYNPIGGALSLRSDLEETSFYSLGTSGGQFGHFQGVARAQYNINEQLKAGIQVFSQKEDQDFRYQEEHASVLLPDRQPHAKILQQGIMGQISYQLNNTHTINSSLWLQGSRREIPPLITQSRSEAVQNDSFYRAQLEWESSWAKYQHRLRFTNRNEGNLYSDPLNGIQNLNDFASLQIQSEHQYSPFRDWVFSYGLSYENIRANTGNYAQEHTADVWMTYLNPVYSLPGLPLQMDLAVRYSQQNSKIAHPGGHIALKWIMRDQSLTLSYQQANRFPSLNDLYWRPGGNIDLQPEFSRQLNLAYSFEKEWGPMDFEQQLNVFYKKVDNWILWAPTEQFIWKPDNLIEVTASGAEYSFRLSNSITERQLVTLEGNFLYQYVRNTGGPGTPLAQMDRNLIYMPDMKINGNLSYHAGPFEISYLHHFRSRVYTRPNLSEFLDPLQLGQVRLAYQFSLWKHRVSSYVQVYNIWDQTYFFQPNRPAPGRYWRLGLLIQNQ